MKINTPFWTEKPFSTSKGRWYDLKYLYGRHPQMKGLVCSWSSWVTLKKTAW